MVPETSAFNFQPNPSRLSGPAFSRTFKGFALVIFGSACAWALQLWQDGAMGPTVQSYGWVGAALVMMGITVWHVLKGTTTLDAQSIQQSWIWSKRIELANLAYAKLIRVKGLEWLIAPRLYTRSFGGKLAVFYTSDTTLLANFERLASELQILRNQQ